VISGICRTISPLWHIGKLPGNRPQNFIDSNTGPGNAFRRSTDVEIHDMWKKF
jgi:hypothetical protein